MAVAEALELFQHWLQHWMMSERWPCFFRVHVMLLPVCLRAPCSSMRPLFAFAPARWGWGAVKG